MLSIYASSLLSFLPSVNLHCVSLIMQQINNATCGIKITDFGQSRIYDSNSLCEFTLDVQGTPTLMYVYMNMYVSVIENVLCDYGII